MVRLQSTESILMFEDLVTIGITDITEAEFDDNINAAMDALNDLTNDYYYFKDFDKEVPYRQLKFKKALAAQIKLFAETGSKTAYGMSEPQTVSIGRTNISKGGSSSDTGSGSLSGYASEAVRLLRPTGLLYRGL